MIAASPAAADDGDDAFARGDYATAWTTWEQMAAQSGHAAYGLGYICQYGLGRDADLAAAQGWYEKAAAQGDNDALLALGMMYEAGRPMPRDLSRAMALYRQAAEAGDPDGEYAVGRMILRGRGVKRDPVEALKWLRRAAEHGNPAGQYMLGAAYEAGWGVKPDEEEAFVWYSRAQAGDQDRLHREDPAFQPGIALQSVRARLGPAGIARAEAKLKATLAAAKAPAAKDGKTATPPADQKPPAGK